MVSCAFPISPKSTQWMITRSFHLMKTVRIGSCKGLPSPQPLGSPSQCFWRPSRTSYLREMTFGSMSKSPEQKSRAWHDEFLHFLLFHKIRLWNQWLGQEGYPPIFDHTGHANGSFMKIPYGGWDTMKIHRRTPCASPISWLSLWGTTPNTQPSFPNNMYTPEISFGKFVPGVLIVHPDHLQNHEATNHS